MSGGSSAGSSGAVISASRAFGLLAAVQSFGNLAASAVAGLLWTAVSPRLAFSYLAAWMGLALVGLLLADHRPWTTSGRDE